MNEFLKMLIFWAGFIVFSIFAGMMIFVWLLGYLSKFLNGAF